MLAESQGYPLNKGEAAIDLQISVNVKDWYQWSKLLMHFFHKPDAIAQKMMALKNAQI